MAWQHTPTALIGRLLRRGPASFVPAARDAVVEGLRDGVVVVDGAGRIVDANPAAAEATGRPRRELLGASAAEALAAFCLASGKGLSAGSLDEVTIPSRNRTYEVRVTSLRAGGRDVQGSLVLLRDVTNRKRRQQDLRMLAQAVRAVGESVALADDDGRVVFVNETFVRTFGYEANELLGRSIGCLLAADNPSGLGASIVATTLEKGGFEGEAVARRRDGTTFPVALSTSSLRADPAAGITHVGVAWDLTERRRVQDGLRRQHQHQEALHETAVALMGRLETHDLLRAILRRASDLLGAPKGSVYLVPAGTGPTTEMSTAANVGYLDPGERVRRGEGLAGQVWATGAPLVVDDYDAWEGRTPGFARGVIGTAAGMPLKSGDEVVGVINLAFDAGSGRRFGPEEMALLTGFARFASIVLDNARLFEGERRARAQAEALVAATRALSATIDLRQVFDVILAELQGVVPYDNASLQELREGRLVVIGGRGFADLDALMGRAFDLGADPNSEVIRRGEPVVLGNAPSEFGRFRGRAEAGVAVRSWLGVPVQFGERLLGMLSLTKEQPGFYTAEHAGLAWAFATQAATAIESARLYAAAQQELAERRRAEEELSRSQARYRELVETATDLIVRTDAEGCWTYANPGVLRLTGWSEAELLGRPWLDFVRADHRQAAGEFYRRQWREQIAETNLELPVLARDGHVVWIGWAMQLVHAHGQPIGFQGLGRDVTERKAAEDELRRAKEAAEEATRAKTTFLANMSHELRTPLNAVLGFVQLMARRPRRSAEDRENLARISRAGEHLLGLINDVLSISRIEAGFVSLERAPFDLPAMLHDLQTLFRGRARAKGLALAFEAGPGLPAVVLGDEGKLRQVLINLLGNAVKFTSSGRVCLRAAARAGRVSFEVADTGPGIGPDELGLLFEPFAQTELGRRAQEGTGLGLALCRRYVRLMGGDVEVASEPGRGSSFRFDLDLPAAEGTRPAPPPRRVAGLQPGQRTFRVLVVDDRPENRLLLASQLSVPGLDVREAEDGLAAVEAWRSWQPDAVFMDLRMPRLDGLGAARRIRQEEAEGGRGRVPIVAVSASVLESEQAAALEAGCDEFLVKPVAERAVFEALARWVGLRLAFEEPETTSDAVPLADLARLASLPPSLLADLAAALRIGDDQAAAEVVDRIRPHDGPVADGLARALRDCQLDQLLELLARLPAGIP